ncbi:MAG: histidine triad nucleotide-binding protein [Gemmatimonadetes bacterium]|nr:histidine triad nucleotide-binding protein [Gemmatimonadota bacterium]
MACLFCKIIAREIPATIVAEDEHCLAFRDINPQAPTHVLVIPKEHVPSLNQVSDPLLAGRVLAFARDLAAREGLAERGYRVVLNTNAEAGQTVFHLHAHLLGGREMGWPPG